MNTSRRVSLFSALPLLLMVVLLCASCSPAPAAGPVESDAPAAEAAPAADAATDAGTDAAADGLESPMLAEKVAAGELPPLEERLPVDVMVVEPEDSVGSFGGTVRVPHAWDQNFELGLLQRLHTDRNEFLPQVAKGWEWADDFTSITFQLREGMKWSDGEPYTADDILFWWNDIVKSEYNLEPFSVAGMNSVTDNVVKVDDYTVRFEFAEPRPNFLVQSRGGWSYGFYGYPAHYFEQFHPAHNGTASGDAQEAFQQLLDRLNQNQYIYNDVDAPTINAWKVIEYEEGQYALFERNAFFFGVDPDGRQLPYIDYIEGMDKYDQDAELLKVQMLAGDADVLFRVVRPSDFPLFQERAEELGVQIVLLDDIFNGRQTFLVNQNYIGDEAIAELLQTADFRRALSLALDRELLNESIYLGLGMPGHGFSEPATFDEAIDGAYATRDLDAANALLDSIGLDGRDSDGFRTLPDGTQLTIALVHRAGWGVGADETVEIAVDNWSEIGLRVNARPVESRLRSELISANDWQITLIPSTGGWNGYWQYGLDIRHFASDVALWMQSATESERRGVEPEGALLELAELQTAATQATDPADAAAAYSEYRAIMADQLFEIGTVANVPAILVVNAKLRNIPGQVEPATIAQGESEYLRVEQWYFAP
jgi:peptide/nickel transport system substrate-binding protein